MSEIQAAAVADAAGAEEETSGAGLFQPTSEFDRRLALGATGVLAEANAAGLLTAADVHTATRVARLVNEDEDAVLLALALVCQAARSGSTGLDLAATIREDVAIAWPDPGDWLDTVRSSAAVAAGVLRVEFDLVYFDRYHELEKQVAADITARAAAEAVPAPQEALLSAGLQRLFPGSEADIDQRSAARAAAERRLTVLTGGPGTGKTTTVAKVLALLAEQADQSGRTQRVALAAPTAKAAARLQEAVAHAAEGLSPQDQQRIGRPEASTLHRLLGWRPDATSRFRHHRGNRLPHDVVVVDEASMISLTLMARLTEAVRDDARLLIVGDSDQLASVDAGAVLADLVAGLTQEHPGVVRLRTVHRFGGGIGDLAAAIREGDADAALEVLHAGTDDVRFVADPQELRGELVEHAVQLRQFGVDGDGPSALALLRQQRLLAAHRTGPYGVSAWNRLIEQWVSEETGERFWTPMYPGRPVLVTANDYANGLLNGDTGIVVRRGDGALRAYLDSATGQAQEVPAARLSQVETMHAMTVHKAQGSQADHVTVLLPEADSPLLTRELIYTGVTRAQKRVTVVGTDEVVRAAIDRRVQRATGLARRLGS
ncbi:exodeoxyribonuclease V subunit alpha [Dermacoccaceae bacterium W4C1]